MEVFVTVGLTDGLVTPCKLGTQAPKEEVLVLQEQLLVVLELVALLALLLVHPSASSSPASVAKQLRGVSENRRRLRGLAKFGVRLTAGANSAVEPPFNLLEENAYD
jgi:hypothetical protein